MEPDWANLEALALSLVLDKLEERIDRVWFGAVCKNWRSIAKLNHQNQHFRTHVLPMLMIPTKRKSRTKRSLYDIPGKKVYPFQLPVRYSKRCCGSTHGWLATVDAKNVITLLNPFKNNVAPITLPPLFIESPRVNFFCSKPRVNFEYNIRKVTLSKDPMTSPNDYVVAAIYSMSCCLAFIRAGQTFWTYIDDIYFFCFTDLIFHNDLVYVSRWNGIVSYSLCYYLDNDPSGSGREEMMIPNNLVLQGTYNETYCHRAYLVKSLEGDLWMVRRFLAFEDGEHIYRYCNKGTQSFQVYKLELDIQSGKVRQMSKLESLRDNVLFVGDNDSISVSGSYFSLQEDSIYYADDYNEDSPIPYPRGPFDLGIYNVKNGSFDHHYPYNPSFKRMPPPFWVLPPFLWD